jgi:hypothetical protein
MELSAVFAGGRTTNARCPYPPTSLSLLYEPSDEMISASGQTANNSRKALTSELPQ